MAGLSAPEKLVDAQRVGWFDRRPRDVCAGQSILDRTQDRGDHAERVTLLVDRNVLHHRMPELLLECIDGALQFTEVMTRLLALGGNVIRVSERRVELVLDSRVENYIEERSESLCDLLRTRSLVVRQTSTNNLGISACENRCTMSNEESGDVI